MIDVKTNKGEINLTATGSINEVYADICCIVHAIYNEIYDDDAKKVFKDTFTEEVSNKNSLMWKDEETIRKECKECKEHDEDEIEEKLKDVFAKLSELLGDKDEE